MRWPEKQRRDYILYHVIIHGWIGRRPIMDTFGVSAPQASIDLRKVREEFPGALRYDASAKRYVVDHESALPPFDTCGNCRIGAPGICLK